jgi:hypothetical protein
MKPANDRDGFDHIVAVSSQGSALIATMAAQETQAEKRTPGETNVEQ